MAVEDDIRGTGVLTNKAPELPTSEPAFDDGSLACLGINTDTRRKMFTCPAKRYGGEGIARCDGDIPRMDELRKYEKP